MKHVAFFGDAERTFALTPDLIGELQRKTDMGIGSLCLRVSGGHFKLADLVETIRLGLIGGGTPPVEAAALADTYAANRPLNEPYALASAILQMVWSGTPAPDGEDSANG
jgi:hypothetical protein